MKIQSNPLNTIDPRRAMALRLAAVLLAVALIALSGCSRETESDRISLPIFPPDTPHAFATETPFCEPGTKCPNGLPCQRGLCANLYFRDEVDKNDDPLNPGCHFSYSDPQCTQNKTFEAGDRCRDHLTLLEWVDNQCHDDMDLWETDCDLLCKTGKPKFDHGVCVSTLNSCGPGNHSARCHCYNDPGTPEV